MPRRRKVTVRTPLPDTKYTSVLVSKIINKVLAHGKKSTATTIVYKAMEIAGKKLEKEPIKVLEQAVKNVTPLIEVRSRRVGGANYQVPTEVKPHRRQSLAIRWLVGYPQDRKGIDMADALANEIIDAYNKTGASFKKKEEVHRMAEANRAFAHFAKY
ncbi:MAG: 30S ribosomal protein S7 [bacterium]